MSIAVMSQVWDRFPAGSSSLLAMLLFADYSDDQGGNIFPSMATIAKRLRLTESQARRVVHGLIREGWVKVVGNETGGAPGSTRQYRIALEKLAQTPCTYARGTGSASATPTGSTDARGTPSMDARDPLHPCADTPSAHASQSISDPSLSKREGKAPPLKRSPGSARGTRLDAATLPDKWREFCQAERPDLDPVKVFDAFRDHWVAQPGQKGVKADWLATWRNWVRRERKSQASAPIELFDDYKPARRPAGGGK